LEKKAGLYRYIMGEGEKRQLPPNLAGLVKWAAIFTTLYNMWAVFGYPLTILHLSICFGLFFALAFLLYTMPGTKTGKYVPWYDWALALLSLSVSVYIFTNLERLITRYPFVDNVYTADIFFGILTIILLLEGARRVIGPWLSLLCLLLIAYALGGQYIPGLFGHNGFSVKTIIDHLFLTTNGIWGMILSMAVTYIIMFIIFGAFLQNSGAGDFFFDFALRLVGWSRGGLAKVSIIASGLFGMISGSPTANVSTVGIITIPMMKKSGYPSDFAAAVECCASTGGIFMPPVMGSVAFIMAEIIGVPYIKVAAAAFLPAVIYYMAVYFAIDFRAGKLGMKGLPRDSFPPLGNSLIKGMIFTIPLIYLVVRLMAGFSPSRVGFETILLIFTLSWLQKDTRMTLEKTLKALAEGTIQGIMIVTTMAASGIMIGIINLTGVGTKFSSFLMAMSGKSVTGTLILTMGLAMFLGLAMNITPSYLLTAVAAGPVLVKLGLSPMAVHFFMLFFAAMAPLTPPVSITAFAAAGIAGAEPMRVGFLSMRIAMVAYFMPYIFIYQPALLLQGSLPSIIFTLISGLLAVALLAMAVEGWYGKNLSPVPRVMLFVAGLLALPGYLPALAASMALAFLALGRVRMPFGRLQTEKCKEIEVRD
jgi:TRAP transporter 4TM/12TM fusion protein